ncbi:MULTISPECIES: low molecular weight protein-tyrosine-phosphatase [Halobacteriovorax]|uniref:Low molecular weight phosphotyrosine protein phosphatase n=1 Tax=Halobacteriovorax vibrionivorans TaxID=2152716 RepID=A0ABY0IGZ8_9BACT|nr:MULTISPECIES: low molecular weight protein-tyrosine-phosphatase [Halobacteriovorax]AYF43636.1 low molecular weight phosphotyrosine protein phosphatase [Halobacteriovorax sp. BALOs_7]RZF21799.1 low molecular weight phosphotyrosine protein phosphatase [Halobacteriovorax vibrionivorans]TGD48366.1 low molecular weight phosphotyrosine protein phosphatase [Halobacteriovorax sp. Y22]
MKILFVCLGNICRSPAADGVLVHKVREQGLESVIEVDSAGTSAYHAGEAADKRMREHAFRRGYLLTSTARGFNKDDFEKFDLILAMDKSNYRNILELNPNQEQKKKVELFCDYCTGEYASYEEVPDPYYGGARGFEEVLNLVENGVEEILRRYGN